MHPVDSSPPLPIRSSPTTWKALALVLTGVVSMGALFYFSWIPSPRMADIKWLPPGLGAWLDSPLMRDPRTALPCVMLGLFAGFLLPMLGPYMKQYLLFGIYVLPLAVELGQIFIPKRTCSLWDVLWGWIGISVGLSLVWLARHWHASTQMPKQK